MPSPSLAAKAARPTAKLVAAVAAIGLLLGALGAVVLPSLGLFKTETKDRSQPVVLKSLTDLSQFRAASANLQDIVEVERDVKGVPSFIAGEKELYVVKGNVDAYVDFRRLRGDNVRVSEDGERIALRLPAASLAKAEVDLEASHPYETQRGALNRIAGVLEDQPTDDRDMLLLAQRKLQAAAAADPSLRDRAQRNTEQMLTRLLTASGFERVDISFAPPPRS